MVKIGDIVTANGGRRMVVAEFFEGHMARLVNRDGQYTQAVGGLVLIERPAFLPGQTVRNEHGEAGTVLTTHREMVHVELPPLQGGGSIVVERNCTSYPLWQLALHNRL